MKHQKKICEVLRGHKDQVMSRWLEVMKEKVPEAFMHSEIAIKNDLPQLIDAIADRLEQEDGELEHFSQKHGVNRDLFREYSLMHIIREYSLFRMCLLHVLDSHIEVKPSDRDKVVEAVDLAIEQAAEVFHRKRQRVEVDARILAQQKAKDLNIADNLRERFINGLTHDLNNPLNNINLSLELIQRNVVFPDDLKKLVHVINGNAKKIENLLSDFLDVQKVESHGLPIKRELVDIHTVLCNEVEQYNISKKHKVKLEMESKKLYVHVDQRVLVRALDNLVGNAMKHGDEEKPITVRCKIDKDNLLLAIHNWGPPIPAERIYEIFHRYFSPESSSQKGWGLGLSIVKAAAQSHGGDVHVKSNMEEGTEFQMVIPLEEKTEQEESKKI